MACVMVSIIIPSVPHRLHLLKHTMLSLRRQTYKNFEVIVVVESFSQKFKQFLKFKDIKVSVVRQDKSGIVNARNCGIRMAKGEIIAFLDDDHIPDPNWLEKVLEIYRRFIGVGGVGVRIFEQNGKGEWRYQIRHMLNNFLNKIANVFFPLLGSVQAVTNTVLTKHFRGIWPSFRKEALEKVAYTKGITKHYFDENLENECMGDWLDISLRVAKYYTLVYVPYVKICHLKHSHHVTAIKSLNDIISRTKNLTYVILKHIKNRREFLKYIIYTLIATSVRSVRNPLHLVATIKGIIEGVKKFEMLKMTLV